MKDWALIVEDEPTWVESHKSLLEDEGFLVDCVSTYEDAKRLIGEKTYVLAVLDLRLTSLEYPKNMFGVYLIEWFLEKGIACLVVTGRANTELVDAICLEYEALPVFSKATFYGTMKEQFVEKLRAAKGGHLTPATDGSTKRARRSRFNSIISPKLRRDADIGLESEQLADLEKKRPGRSFPKSEKNDAKPLSAFVSIVSMFFLVVAIIVAVFNFMETWKAVIVVACVILVFFTLILSYFLELGKLNANQYLYGIKMVLKKIVNITRRK